MDEIISSCSWMIIILGIILLPALGLIYAIVKWATLITVIKIIGIVMIVTITINLIVKVIF